MSEDRKTPLLEVKNIKKWFPAKKSPFSREKVYIKAVDGVSFTLNEGETLGVVGESGCGKSTMGRTVLRLIEPTEGQVLFEGKDYTALKDAELRKSRTDLQIIFQDPYASLDPRMTIGDIIAEPLDIQLKLPAKERMERVLKTMERVGLNTRYVNRYPHEFSGGQRLLNQTTKKWEKIRTYGGKLTENVVQSIARDILGIVILRAQAAGLNIVFHVHDEIVVEAEKGQTLSDVEALFSKPIEWCRDLPLKGAGYTTPYYLKD